MIEFIHVIQIIRRIPSSFSFLMFLPPFEWSAGLAWQFFQWVGLISESKSPFLCYISHVRSLPLKHISAWRQSCHFIVFRHVGSKTEFPLLTMTPSLSFWVALSKLQSSYVIAASRWSLRPRISWSSAFDHRGHSDWFVAISFLRPDGWSIAYTLKSIWQDRKVKQLEWSLV